MVIRDSYYSHIFRDSNMGVVSGMPLTFINLSGSKKNSRLFIRTVHIVFYLLSSCWGSALTGVSENTDPQEFWRILDRLWNFCVSHFFSKGSFLTNSPWPHFDKKNDEVNGMIRIHSHDREDIWFGFLAWNKQKSWRFFCRNDDDDEDHDHFPVINMTNDESNKLQWLMNMLLLMMYDTWWILFDQQRILNNTNREFWTMNKMMLILDARWAR